MKNPIQIFRNLIKATNNISANAFSSDTQVEFFQALAEQAQTRKEQQEQNARLLSGEGLLKATDLYHAVRDNGMCEELGIHSARDVSSVLVERGFLLAERHSNGYSYCVSERAAKVQLGKTQFVGSVSNVAWDPCMVDVLLAAQTIDDIDGIITQQVERLS